MPSSLIFEYMPGPRVPVFVLLKSPSSKNFRVPDRMIIEEM
jgi:hypothetical protein